MQVPFSGEGIYGKNTAKQGDGKLSWPVCLSYAGGDAACNVVFGMVGTLLTLFYTDYVGINPATVGLIIRSTIK